MEKLARGVALLGLGLLTAAVMSTAGEAKTNAPAKTPVLAVISYWNTADLAKLPPDSLAVINPNDGVLGASKAVLEQARAALGAAAKRGVRFLGYVPMGYGERVSGRKNSGGTTGRTLEEIEAEVSAYHKAFSSTGALSGIFFDEADEPCAQAVLEYKRLGKFVRSKGLSTVAWNPGWTGEGGCFVRAAQKGEIVATFEDSLKSYQSDPDVKAQLARAQGLARARGVHQWHLIRSAKSEAELRSTLKLALERGADLVYVTDIGGNWQAGENTWGSPPKYWALEVSCLARIGRC